MLAFPLRAVNLHHIFPEDFLGLSRRFCGLLLEHHLVGQKEILGHSNEKGTTMRTETFTVPVSVQFCHGLKHQRSKEVFFSNRGRNQS